MVEETDGFLEDLVEDYEAVRCVEVVGVVAGERQHFSVEEEFLLDVSEVAEVEEVSFHVF